MKMTLTIEKSKSKKKDLVRVQDPKPLVSGGNRKPPTKPPHSAIATDGKDDDDKRRLSEIKERMDREDFEMWEQEFDRYEAGWDE